MKRYVRISNIFLSLLLVYTVYSCISQRIIMKDQKRELKTWKNELSRVKRENQELKDMVDMIHYNPRKWYEKQAREKLGLIKPGEIPVLDSNSELDKNTSK